MKNFTTKILIVLISITFGFGSTLAQAPEGIIYQAEARDSNGELLTNKSLKVRIFILEGNVNGLAAWEGEHQVITNNYGMFVLVIGTGSNILGTSFDDIRWDSNSYFLNVKVLSPSNNIWIDMGTSQFLSVPYALHARTASSLVPDPTSNLKGALPGVPSQNWSLFGNLKSDPEKDKLGTTDETDLVLVTNNLERLRIESNGDIKLSKSLEVGEDLTVKRNVYLNTVEGETINNGPLTVQNNKPTLLTGTLTVDGRTQLNSNLNVDATSITNKLIVTDEETPSELNRDGSIADIRGLLVADEISVLGDMDIGGILRVHGDSVIVDHNLRVKERSLLEGQVTINTKNPLSGGDDSYGAYPLRVEGSNQGIAIKVNSGTPNNSNNFVTFFDSNNNPVGRIEGETAGEVASTPEYIVETTILTAEVVAAGVNIGLSALPNACAGVGAVACPPEPSVVAIAIAEEILAIANEAAYQAFAFSNLGVTYQSGSADYAEWLERSNPDENLLPGDIVGVQGGKVSKSTESASNYFVVSTKPAILGNMPDEGENPTNFNKIAFMGQVPTKVRNGANVGDYIIPSGFNDGTGIAVEPDKLAPENYSRIVGVAWSSASADQRISVINMAIGLNMNHVAKLVLKQQKYIEEIESNLNCLEERILALEEGRTEVEQQKSAMLEEADNFNSGVAYATLDVDLVDNALMLLKNEYEAKGIDINQHAGLKKLFENEEFRTDIIQNIKQNYEKNRSLIQEMGN